MPLIEEIITPKPYKSTLTRKRVVEDDELEDFEVAHKKCQCEILIDAKEIDKQVCTQSVSTQTVTVPKLVSNKFTQTYPRKSFKNMQRYQFQMKKHYGNPHEQYQGTSNLKDNHQNQSKDCNTYWQKNRLGYKGQQNYNPQRFNHQYNQWQQNQSNYHNTNFQWEQNDSNYCDNNYQFRGMQKDDKFSRKYERNDSRGWNKDYSNGQSNASRQPYGKYSYFEQ